MVDTASPATFHTQSFLRDQHRKSKINVASHSNPSTTFHEDSQRSTLYLQSIYVKYSCTQWLSWFLIHQYEKNVALNINALFRSIRVHFKFLKLNCYHETLLGGKEKRTMKARRKELNTKQNKNAKSEQKNAHATPAIDKVCTCWIAKVLCGWTYCWYNVYVSVSWFFT